MGSYGRAVRVLTGTSGWSYPAWKGSFYPRDLPATRFLEHYASRLATVEVNATFYRMPLARTLALWRAQAPAGFVFALKAPQRITHQKRLLGVGEDVAHFFGAAVALGSALGPVLFQLPPSMKRDVPRLRALLEIIPSGARAAFEFRHESWLSADVLQTVADAGAALCIADTDEGDHPARGDRTVRLPAPAPHELRRRRARTLGGASPRAALGRGLRVLQARGRGARTRVRAPAGGARNACRGVVAGAAWAVTGSLASRESALLNRTPIGDRSALGRSSRA